MADRLGQPLKVSRRRALRVAGGTSVGLFMTGSTPADWAIRSAGAQEPLAFPGDPLAALLHGQGLDARDFGARFDGTSDDSEALQRASNAGR
jgi:polygalacturonase